MTWRRPGDKPLTEPMMACFVDAYMRHSASMSYWQFSVLTVIMLYVCMLHRSHLEEIFVKGCLEISYGAAIDETFVKMTCPFHCMYLFQVVIIMGLIALMPLMATYYLILPRSRLGQLLRTPFMKFTYHSASFGVFLVLLMMVSANVSGGELERLKQRGPPPTPLECLIVSYVGGELSPLEERWGHYFVLLLVVILWLRDGFMRSLCPYSLKFGNG